MSLFLFLLVPGVCCDFCLWLFLEISVYLFSLFANRTWLHYDEANDLEYCHVCMVAYRDGKLNSSNLDKAFILNGFSSWKDSSVNFKNTTLQGAIMIR